MRQLQRRQQGTFTWGLNDITGINLPECGTVSLFLSTTQLSGQPLPAGPYSLIAYPVQGLPAAYPLSLTGTIAPWTVNYPAGTRLLLNIADAMGNSGGVPPEIYTVQSNQSKACLPSTSTPIVTMKIDEPSALKTCTVLPIHIEGGQKPYTVTLAVADSVAPSNRTLGNDHDTFEWVNQSAANSTLILAVSDSKGQYALASKLFVTSGSTDASCPGQSSRSYNSNNPNAGSNNSTGNNSTGSDSNNQGSGNSNNDQKAQTPIGAIIGAAVGAMVLLGLILLVFFRRKNKGRKGGVGILERKRYHKPGSDHRPSLGHRPGLDHSPDGSQAPFAHHNTSVSMHQNHVQSTPYVPPGTRSSAALSYYGENPTSPTSPRYLPPSSILAATNHQQGPEDRQPSPGYGWQPGLAYPPLSPMPPPNYPPYNNQGTVTSTGQRISYNADIATNATHLIPHRTSTTLGTSGYDDNVSRYSGYTVQSAAATQGSEAGSSVQGAAVGAAAETRREMRKPPMNLPSQSTGAAAETQQEMRKPPLNQPSQSTGGAPLVYQHEDARDVVELPPAYREWSASESSPPPPL